MLMMMMMMMMMTDLGWGEGGHSKTPSEPIGFLVVESSSAGTHALNLVDGTVWATMKTGHSPKQEWVWVFDGGCPFDSSKFNAMLSSHLRVCRDAVEATHISNACQQPTSLP